jgi:hypothetical protein
MGLLISLHEHPSWSTEATVSHVCSLDAESTKYLMGISLPVTCEIQEASYVSKELTCSTTRAGKILCYMLS